MGDLRTWAIGVAVVALVAGCESGKPYTANGPNEVVFSVPTMT